jgi:arylsulfatase A-like enzyme
VGRSMLLFAVLVSFACGSSHSNGGESRKPGADKQPNVLFIAIDDMNDWVGFLGGHPQAKTPNMDKLARRGVNFTNAHCIAPACSPCRLGLLYGVEPFNSGLYPFYDRPERMKTFQEKTWPQMKKKLKPAIE